MIKKYAGIAGVIFNIRPPKEGFSGNLQKYSSAEKQAVICLLFGVLGGSINKSCLFILLSEELLFLVVAQE